MARLDLEGRARLSRLMAGVVRALPLGPGQVAHRVLGTRLDAPGIASFVQAGAAVQSARDAAGLRAATDLLGRSAVEMGLDRFPPFLRQADAHLDKAGGLLTLAREVPLALPEATPRVPPVTPELPPLGRLGPLLSGVLSGALGGAVAGLASVYFSGEDERQLRAIMERFALDPRNPADVAAAIAFRWAEFKGPWRLGMPPSGPQMEAMAERVMRVVRADPGLLPGALADDLGVLETLRAAAQGELVPGFPDRVQNDEERALVERLLKEGKGVEDIRAALDALRKTQGRPGRITLPTNSDELLKQGWIETSHPLARASGRRTFRNPVTGEELAFDKAKLGRSGYAGKDHYHRLNPDRASTRKYLDQFGNPVLEGSNASHLLPGN